VKSQALLLVGWATHGRCPSQGGCCMRSDYWAPCLPPNLEGLVDGLAPLGPPIGPLRLEEGQRPAHYCRASRGGLEGFGGGWGGWGLGEGGSWEDGLVHAPPPPLAAPRNFF
jgi:hypothetical protein